MSLICCADCGGIIDTDDEPEAYSEKADKWLCWWCREDIEENDGAGLDSVSHRSGLQGRSGPQEP